MHILHPHGRGDVGEVWWVWMHGDEKNQSMPVLVSVDATIKAMGFMRLGQNKGWGYVLNMVFCLMGFMM